MKALIEDYRGFEISFDTEKSVFYCFSDSYDTENTSKSYDAVKKYIDDYIKANKTFKSFVVYPVPNSYKKEPTTITGIRKDGGFTYVDEIGKPKKVSNYDENEYYFINPSNESALSEMQSLEEQKNQIRERIKTLKETLIIKTLADYRKENPELFNN